MSIDELITSPSKYFETPDKILYADQLTVEQKEIALKNWKQQCIHDQESTAEGMEPKNNNGNEILKLVNHSLEKFKAMTAIFIICLSLASCDGWEDEKDTVNDIGNTIEREGKNAIDGLEDTAEGVGEMIERESEPYTD